MSWKEQIKITFQDAMPFAKLLNRTRKVLAPLGINPKNTLFGTATCRDEINKKAIDLFAAYWGENFELSGLGGYPFAGLTGFNAFANHIPDNGTLFILYGPHLGINKSGEFGKIFRTGMKQESSSCGALLNFLGKIQADNQYVIEDNPLDYEQVMLEKELLPAHWKILDASQPALMVTEQAYNLIEKRIFEIIEEVQYQRQIVLLGGIMLNTPMGKEDQFVVKKAELYNADHVAGKEHSLIEQILPFH